MPPARPLFIASVLVLSVGMSCALAQTPPSDPLDQPPPASPSPVDSHFCPFSLFTHGDDRLALHGRVGSACLDLGRGEDVLRLKPEDFPDGTVVIADRGRSVIRTSHSPALVFDQEGTAAEIRTGPASDTIRIGLPFTDAHPPILTPETRIYPGGGDDLIVVGSGTRPASSARAGANLRIFPSSSPLSVEAGCGRMTDPSTIDAIIEQAPADARIHITAKGCGIALREHAGTAVLDQQGGRTAGVLEPDGDHVPVYFDANIDQSAGLSWVAYEPREDSTLDWTGYGNAALQVIALSPQTGGKYSVRGDSAIFVHTHTGAGSPEFSLLSTDRIEARIESDSSGQTHISMAAPVMRLDWRPEGDGSFPRIEIDKGEQVNVEPFQAKAAKALWRPPVPAPKMEEAAEEKPGEAVTPSKEGESDKDEKTSPSPDAPLSSEGLARDAQGRTAPATEALVGGYRVGSVLPEREEVDWATEPAFAAPGALTVVISPAAGWCGWISVGEMRASCDEKSVFDLDGVVRITRPDGRIQDWTVEGLERASQAQLLLVPR